MTQPVVVKPAVQGPIQPVAAPVQPVAAAPEPAQAVQPVQQVVQQQPAQPVVDNRTREQFEKLLENNTRLHEANRLLTQEVLQRTQLNTQFAPIQGGQPQQAAVQDFVEIDPETGVKYINERKLQSQLSDANVRATRAENAVQNYIQASEQREIERQNKEAFATYPELNPTNPAFNPALSNQTSAVILHSMMNPRNYGGRPLTFVEAANLVKGTPGTQPQAAPQVPAQAVGGGVSTQDLRAQASADFQSQPPQVLPNPQMDRQLEGLQARTRLGDDQALAERLKYTEHIVPKDEA
jgi:hypothetical protein